MTAEQVVELLKQYLEGEKRLLKAIAPDFELGQTVQRNRVQLLDDMIGIIEHRIKEAEPIIEQLETATEFKRRVITHIETSRQPLEAKLKDASILSIVEYASYVGRFNQLNDLIGEIREIETH